MRLGPALILILHHVALEWNKHVSSPFIRGCALDTQISGGVPLSAGSSLCLPHSVAAATISSVCLDQQ